MDRQKLLHCLKQFFNITY